MIFTKIAHVFQMIFYMIKLILETYTCTCAVGVQWWVQLLVFCTSFSSTIESDGFKS